MRKLPAVLARGLFFCLFCYSFAFAVPDPRDSIILESKTVYFGAGSPALYLRVFFTNKDTLRAYNLALVEKSVSGGAYAVLSRPWSYDGVVRHLDSTLNNMEGYNFAPYNAVSPDTFIVGGFSDPTDPSNWQPPNLTRKAFLEIKFDTVRTNPGTISIDSVTWTKMGGGGLPIIHSIQFINNQRDEVGVNFLKSTITVVGPPPSPPCNDMNGDGGFSAADIVEALNCVFLGEGSCGAISTPADVVGLMKSLFSNPLPLIPPTPCD